MSCIVAQSEKVGFFCALGKYNQIKFGNASANNEKGAKIRKIGKNGKTANNVNSVNSVNSVNNGNNANSMNNGNSEKVIGLNLAKLMRSFFWPESCKADAQLLLA